MLDALVDTLLYEGYALYPYTPGATKNATPTPFGIVYPPAYAAGSGATFDVLQIQCLCSGSAVSGEVHFLQASGVRHEGTARRVDLPGPGHARVRLRRPARHGLALLRRRPHDDPRREPHRRYPRGSTAGRRCGTRCSRPTWWAASPAGRFVSPLEAAGCEQINSWPVLATPEDDAVLGAAIMLPDHPQIAPESRGSLFDSTEIEEALLIHVLALSDEERESAASQDPAVRQMLERAARTTPQELMDLHGRVTVADPREGEASAEVDGVLYRRGDTVVLRPAANATPQDHLVAGRRATVERIYHDYDGTVHLAVTVDDVPGQDVMRDIGRYLYFKTSEVEVA